jgi:hypothetical protein
LKIEILAMKGPAIPSFELREPGVLRVTLQMGMSKEDVEASCALILHPELTPRIIRLWAENDCERDFLEQGRHLLICESE